MKTATASNSGESKQVEIDFTLKEVKEIDVTPIKKVRVPKVPKVKPEKFEMSKSFKNTLLYIKEIGNDTMKSMVDRILSKKIVTEDGINYVGISSTDSTKISYLDKTRSDKYKEDIAPTLFLTEGSIVKYNTRRRLTQYWGDAATYTDPIPVEVPITKSNLKNYSGQNCTPIKISLRDTFGRLPVPNEQGFYSVEDLFFHFAEASESYMHSLSLYKGRSRSYNYESLQINLDSGSLDIRSSEYSPKSDLMIKPRVINIKKVWDPKIRYESTPGKLLRKLFNSEYNDKELSEFSDLFREYGSVGIPGFTYREEVGEKIRENYLEDNYLSGGAGLNSSCMRYNRCQKFFDLYVHNPNTRLATLYYNKKVAARALVWKGETETYVDRIYSATSQSEGIMKNLVRKYKGIYNTPVEAEVKVSREFMESLESAPYMDSLYYYDVEKEVLTKAQPKGPHFYMRNQHGNIQKRTSPCSCCGTITEDTYGYYVYDSESDSLVSSERVACSSCLYYIDGIDEEWNTGYILRTEVVSTSYGPCTHRDLVVTLIDGRTTSRYNRYLHKYENNYGYFILYEYYEYHTSKDLYYHPEDPESPENKKATPIVQAASESMTTVSTGTINLSSLSTSSTNFTFAVDNLFDFEEEDDAN